MDEPKDPEGQELSRALEATLDDLTASIQRMETIIKSLESGQEDWEESVRLLSEANDLAMSSSQKLDRAVQDVVYGGGKDEEIDEEEESGS
jgi:exonuclease VII small subunit